MEDWLERYVLLYHAASFAHNIRDGDLNVFFGTFFYDLERGDAM